MLTVITGMSIVIGCMIYELIKMKLILIEKNRLLTIRAKSLKNAESKVEITQRNSEIILKANTELSNVISDITKIVFKNQYNSEKETIQKIRDLTRKYQTPIR